ncbi:outer membrane beta-barrel protein [Acidocella aromatica]|uniref:Uncharacterized protein n=1 Tax=Acidocella aromatica TaxID=1303579 RepID=A0A840VPX3_9PROT|nr:hypothetical protein [Acidocella aromatica]
MTAEKHLATALTACLALAAPAKAQQLDLLLPDDSVPGYGRKFSVIAEHRNLAPGATGWEWNGVTLAPQLGIATGYDSAPNGAAGSTLFNASPSLLVSDPVAGFGAYAEVNTSRYPQDVSQNTVTAALAGGERIELPREVITIAAAYLRGAETGFNVDTPVLTHPLVFTLTDLRASDEISSGMFTLKPEIDAGFYSFPDMPELNRRDMHEALTLSYAPDGPLRYVMRLHATQSDYKANYLTARTNEILAGVEDKADGLWTLSLLAGAAQRHSRDISVAAPVLEARLDWLPTQRDKVQLAVLREIDDPDEISATPYRLTEAKLSLEHSLLENVIVNGVAKVSNVAYMKGNSRETLVAASLEMGWYLTPNLALNGSYEFNNRQANYVSAASEHVVTMGLEWMP